MKKYWPIFQFIWFQALWFTAIMLQNDGLIWLALLLTLHFVLSPTVLEDLLVLPIAALGVLIDFILIEFGFFMFPTLPIWLIALWIGFTLTIGHSLKWMKEFPLIALSLIGSMSGMLSYWAGHKFNAVEFPQGLFMTLIVLMVIWSILFPVVLKLNFHLRKLL